MNLKETLLSTRQKNNLTQEEFAEKLHVTRQAVSRWENGETTPSIDTLKKVSALFNINPSVFFGVETPICQSCAMPLRSLDDLSENADKTANTEYCHHCFDNGQFTHNRTIEEMVESNLRFLKEFNESNGTSYTEDEAWTILKLHLATLKRWKKD